ncbi:MAG TPA: DUF4446 family protein [Candidatus Limnocylindrales bacterium]|nr:DUF4446 family protein [Candidatus Limnocylindrales bacterium]
MLAVAALAVGTLGLLVSIFALTRSRSGQRTPVATRPDPTLAEVGLRLDQLNVQLAAIESRVGAAEGQAKQSMQSIGVVRFNPFEDTGSNQSFVLALLDGRGDGFVLSSMHSRQATRVFLKAVSAGRTDSAVSKEETEAIRRALQRDKVE